MLRSFGSLLVAITLLMTALPASAQERGPDPLIISVSPEAPQPGQTTTITLSSTPIKLGQAQITWSVNGSVQKSGPGEQSFTFTMGSSQSATVISVNIVPFGGSAITRTFTFRPGSITLVWEANTYVPPFYRGKSLYSPGADVRILAIPQVREPSGALIPSSELTFKWSVDDQGFADRSGLGRDAFYLSGAQLIEDQTVAVDVLRQNGLRAAHAEIVIPRTSPIIRLYKKDPLRGIMYSEAYSGNVRLPDTETTFQAEPYFISGKSREPERVVYTWALNDEPIEPPGSERSVVTLRQTAGQSGSARLSVSVQNADLRRLLQQATEEIRLLFGSQ